MSRFVLLPCRLREDRLVPQKGAEPFTVDWRELAAKLAPSNRIEALKTLKHVQRGAFVGLVDQGEGRPPSNFVYVAQDRSGNFSEVVKRDPGFGEKLLEVYQVLEADRGAAMKEADHATRSRRAIK